MTVEAESRDVPTSTQKKPVVDPVSIRAINWIGFGYLLLAILFFYLLMATWPVQATTTTFKPFNLFGFWCSWAPDRRMIFTVMMAGALGSLTHTMTSFSDYVGNRELSSNWLWFLALRVPVGIAVAVLFYFIIRGGILIPTVQGNPKLGFSPEDTVAISPYAMAGFAALAGMFSKQATDKLADVFNAVFAMKKPVERADALGSTHPLTISPATLIQGKPQTLTVTGSGFQDDTKATINGKDRPFTKTSPTQGRVTVLDEDVKDAGTLSLVITNPNKDNFSATIKVDAAAAAKPGKPSISATDPEELTADGPKTLTVSGEGFESGCTATINDEPRSVTPGDDKTLTIALQDRDLTAGSTLRLVIKNPGAQGLSSDPFNISVK